MLIKALFNNSGLFFLLFDLATCKSRVHIPFLITWQPLAFPCWPTQWTGNRFQLEFFKIIKLVFLFFKEKCYEQVWPPKLIKMRGLPPTKSNSVSLGSAVCFAMCKGYSFSVVSSQHSKTFLTEQCLVVILAVS